MEDSEISGQWYTRDTARSQSEKVKSINEHYQLCIILFVIVNVSKET